MLKYLALEVSTKKGYLVSSSLSLTLCEMKMESDIAIMEVRMSSSETISQMIYKESSSMFERIGTVGMSSPLTS